MIKKLNFNIKNIYDKNNDDKINKNNKIYFTTILAIFSFIILNLSCAYFYTTKSNENDKFFRLHVVSNSNSITDLITKLKVNENVNNYISTLFKDCENSTSEEKEEILKNNINNILEVSNNTLKNDNKNYTSTLKYGKIKYNEKEDLKVYMDKGSYNSMQIVLGDGNGENIWSLLFPDEENIKSLYNYETITPGISKVYNSKDENIEYESLILKNIKKYLD